MPQGQCRGKVDQDDPSGVFRPEQADQDDLPNSGLDSPLGGSLMRTRLP
jgi:hypothetical protein